MITFWTQFLSYVVVFIVDAGIALFILLKGTKKDYIKWIALTSLFAALYALPFMFLMFWPTSGFLSKLTWIGIFIIPSYLTFAMKYINWSKIKTTINSSMAYIFASFIFITAVSSDLVTPNAINWYPQRMSAGNYGPIHPFARLYVFIYLVFGIAILIKAYKIYTPLQKEKIKYFLLGLIIYAASGIFFTGILPLYTNRLYIDVPIYFSCIWMLLTIYAVYKYRLFEINFVIARSFMIIFVAAVLISIQISSTWVLNKVLPNVLSSFLSTALVAGVFFMTPFRYKAQAFFDHLFLKNRYQYLELLKNSIKVLNSFSNVNALLEYVIQITKTAFNPPKLAILLRSSGNSYTVQVSDGLPDHILKQPISNGLVTWLDNNKQTFIKDEWIEKTSEWHTSGLYKVLQGLEAQLCIPFLYKNDIKGILSMSNKSNGKTYTAQDIDLLELICTDAATIIENSRLSQEATIDELTKLNHRRLLNLQLEKALSRSKENKSYIGILMIDIDYFKKINDTYGHLCGDEALKYVASILKESCGAGDTAYRYGGEEFTILVTEKLSNITDTNNPEEILTNYAESVRKVFEVKPFTCKHGSSNITISIGATIFDGINNKITSEDLIKVADSALYQAKRQGRNRVVFSL